MPQTLRFAPSNNMMGAWAQGACLCHAAGERVASAFFTAEREVRAAAAGHPALEEAIEERGGSVSAWE